MLRHRASGSARRAADGFTLIELLVVLTIMALALAAVPNIVAGLPGVRLRAAADAVTARLRSLREAAILDEETTEFDLDPRVLRYRVSTEAAIRSLPPVVDAVAFRTTGLFPAGRVARLQFYADGSASGGTIVLRHGDLSQSIVVDWLTGRVSKHE